MTPSLRKIEARLLIFSLVVVSVAVLLCFLGKLSTTTTAGNNDLNVNSASAKALTEYLGVSKYTAQLIVSHRQSQPSHLFASISRFRRDPALTGLSVNWDRQPLTVRSFGTVFWTCFGCLIALIVVAFAVHVVIRNRCPEADPFLYPIVILLSGIGLVISLSVHDPIRDTFAFPTQATGVIGFGMAALVVPVATRFRKLPLHRYTYIYAALAVVFLITLFTFGKGPAATHIQLFGFEPIEVIKVLLIFFMAAYLAERRFSSGTGTQKKTYLPNVRDILPLLTIYLFALSLFGAVKDLGPAVLLFGSFVAMLYLVTGQVVYPLLGVVMLLLAAYFGDKLGFGFFATRVEMWLHPWDNSNRLGGQLAQGLWGISTGGIFGSGLGLGASYYVPRAGSDMAFTSIGEELGLVGGLCVLTLYSVIVYRGFQIARSGLDDFDRLLASGITVLIGLQAVVIAGGDTGLIPLTGITLPFVSYGTSSLVANFFCIGILLNLSSKARSSSIPVNVPPTFIRTSRRLVSALSVGLLIFVGVGRLMWLQGIDDVQTATDTLRIPDADRIYRIHRNPRLAGFAAMIPRGEILDRNGLVLAENTVSSKGVSYLTGGVQRLYPYGEATGNIVYAVEQPATPFNPLGCDEILRGYGSLDDLLPLYRDKDLPLYKSPTGKNVTLTIDAALQRTVQNSLDSAVSKYGTGGGAAVVLDARTGALLAAVTAPTFDPNALTDSTWSELHSKRNLSNPLLDRAFAGVYVPGSVFKLVTATAALQQNKANLTFTCNHRLPIIRWSFNAVQYSRRNITDDRDFPPHGDLSMGSAIRQSCNVYFAQLGVALGAPALESTIRQYGLLESPNLATLASDLPDCAYGQGDTLVTPYQMAVVCQTIANDGVRSSPSFYVGDKQGNSDRRILSPADAESLGLMMESVVLDGTAAGVFDGLSVAGKTGSAQVDNGAPHSWFVGFAPATAPSIAFSCIVEHGGVGRRAAGSVCRDIVLAALNQK